MKFRFQRIRPMWRCWACGKTMVTPECDGGANSFGYEPPDGYGWAEVWKGYAGWVWLCPDHPHKGKRRE